MNDKTVIFDFTNPMKTEDNFYVKLKGFVEISEEGGTDDILNSVKNSCKNYLQSVTLMEALDLVNPDESAKLIDGLGDHRERVNKLEVSTVDAIEQAERTDVDIDPSLESQKQKQGFFSRVKSLFKR